MNRTRFILITLVSLLGGAMVHAQEPTRGGKTQEAAAAQALAILQALGSEKEGANARDLGFSSGNDAARATLGAPLAVYSVELNGLKTFKSGDDAGALLKRSASAFYPVLLEGAVRSGVRVENTAGGWEPTRFGNSGLATAVDRARRALPKPDDAGTSIVQVLALNLVFVAQRDGSGWLLAPVIDDASVELKVGSAEPAARVFTRLAPLAARHNGEPT